MLPLSCGIRRSSRTVRLAACIRAALSCVGVGGLLAFALPVFAAGSETPPADGSPQPAAPSSPSDAGDLTKLSLAELMEVRVSTVSRVDEKIDAAPGSVYLFSRQTIQERGYRSLGELLQVVPGFTVLHRDLQFVAGVRGLNANDNEKITLLINGQYVNGVNEPDFLNGPINLDNAQRVEVIVGPSSLFQQANTLAATVNLITTDVEGVDIIGSTGTNLRYSTTVMAGHHWAADQSLSFSFTTEDKKGFDAWSGDFRPNDADRNLTGALDQPNFFGILHGRYGELSGQLIAYRTKLPELLIDNGDPGNEAHLVDQFYTLSLKIEHPFSKDLTGVITADTTYKQQYRRNDAGRPINAEQQNLTQMVYTTDGSLRYSGIKNHFLQGGVQLSYDHNFDSWYTLDSTDLTVDRTTLIDDDTHAIGIYGDDTFRLSEQWQVVAGARIDRNTRLDGGRWFPGWRTGIIFEPSKSWTSKLIYNRAVRIPSALAALNQAWGAGKPGAPGWAALAPNATDPEALTTLEWENIVYVGGARLGATLYHQDLKDFISWFGPHTNVGNFSGNGVELSAQLPLDEHWLFWANASYNSSKLEPFAQYGNPASGGLEEHHVLTNGDGRIIGAPEFTANVGLDYHITQNVSLSPTVRYFTEQAAFDYTSSDDIVIRNRFYLDLALLWKNVLGKNTDLRITGTNLLDNREPVGGQWLRDTYRPEGIALTASLEWRF